MYYMYRSLKTGTVVPYVQILGPLQLYKCEVQL
jgi:hypothetical protein